MSLKFYEDLSWFGKILYRLRLRKAIKKSAYREYLDNTLMLEKLERDDVVNTRYLDYLLDNFREVDRKWEL